MGYLITKTFIGRPVTAFLIVLSIVFFGFMSITQFNYELMPETSMPMYVVSTIYPGGQPEDIDDLITRKLEDEFYNLQGIKHIQSSSRENVSVVVAQYNYGQNMDKAYTDIKKAVDAVKGDFDDNVEEPSIYELSMNSNASIKLSIKSKKNEDIYNYVKETFAKNIEKISEVSEVTISGGQENYIKVELNREMMDRYGLSMDTLKSIIANADFAYPGGDVNVGDRKLSFSSTVKYNDVASFNSIPIITGNNRTLYLEDIATTYLAKKDKEEIGRYDDENCIIVAISKTQSANTISLSNKVNKEIQNALADNENLEIVVIDDDANHVNSSIHSVFETMVIAIVLSMLIIWLFLGDMKASLIVGTSIPFSILTSFVCMYLSGYTLNVVTLSALVLGVGMMVDNSIVVLEACFRASDEFVGKKDVSYFCRAGLKASKTIGFSVFGSTLTTVVVFAPLGFLTGMSGQFFKPLGFTIVYCMLASYVSALSVVPLLYVVLRPTEKKTSPAGGFVRSLQNLYRKVVPTLVKNRIIVAIFSIVLLVASFMLIGTFKTELVADPDNAMIKLDITTKPGLSIDAKDKIYLKFENFVKAQPEVIHYVLSNTASNTSLTSTSSGQALIAYLCDEKDRKETTAEIVSRWKKELANETDVSLDITSYTTAATSQFNVVEEGKMEIYLKSSSYEKLQQVNDEVVKELKNRDDCVDVTSSLDKGAPVVKATIDPIVAAAEGFVPASIGGLLYNTLSGLKVMDKIIDGDTYEVDLEYPKNEYDTIEKVSNMVLTNSKGYSTTLKDIAKIEYKDNPSAIPKYDKKYQTTISLFFNEKATDNTEKEINETIIKPKLNKNIELGTSTVDEILDEEFGQLYVAIAVAAFLVFVVMASQFESGRYSAMVMGTVLFSFAGGFFALWLANLKLSMVVLLGFLMLIGTAVNNGILYVDTVNQNIEGGMELMEAMVEAGAIRLRPILMTTLTTIVSMIPMSMAYGNNGEILQGLAVVDIGGLVASTIMALFILPCIYRIFAGRKGTYLERLRPTAAAAITLQEDIDRKKEIENMENRMNNKD